MRFSHFEKMPMSLTLVANISPITWISTDGKQDPVASRSMTTAGRRPGLIIKARAVWCRVPVLS